MFLYLIFLCCVIQPLFHHYGVFGKRESLQRFIVEEGAKPAIFGSYSYDPVKQVFVPPPPDNETVHPGDTPATVSKIPDQIVNGSYVHSTAVGDITPDTEHTTHHGDHSTTHHGEHATNHTTPVFRKHVTSQPPKNSAWWTRQKLPIKNTSSNLHKLNNIL